MEVIYATVHVKDENMDEFLKVMTELARKSAAEPQCGGYHFVQRADNHNEFAFIEFWPTPDSHEAHRQSQHFKTLFPKMCDLTEEGVQDIISRQLV